MSFSPNPPCGQVPRGGSPEGRTRGSGYGVLIGFSVLLAGLQLLAKGISHENAVTALLIIILVYAAYEDMLSRRVRNITVLAVLATGLLRKWNISGIIIRLIFALAVFILLALIYYFFPKRTPGGGDIKMLAALAFSFGPERFMYSMLMTLGFCIFALILAPLTGCKNAFKQKIPFMPLLCSGVWVHTMIWGLF